MAVTAQYCEPWLRPQEAFTLSTTRDTVRAVSEDIRRMLGYTSIRRSSARSTACTPNACSNPAPQPCEHPAPHPCVNPAPHPKTRRRTPVNSA